jgi:hypothetical protein
MGAAPWTSLGTGVPGQIRRRKFGFVAAQLSASQQTVNKQLVNFKSSRSHRRVHSSRLRRLCDWSNVFLLLQEKREGTVDW